MKKNIITVWMIAVFVAFCMKAMAADAAAGKAKFDALCASCHGASGKGDGPVGASLNPKPKDLTQTTRSDADLKKVVKEGGAASGLSPLMPAWGASLTDADIDNVILHIRSLKK